MGERPAEGQPGLPYHKSISRRIPGLVQNANAVYIKVIKDGPGKNLLAGGTGAGHRVR